MDDMGEAGRYFTSVLVWLKDHRGNKNTLGVLKIWHQDERQRCAVTIFGVGKLGGSSLDP